MKRFRADWIYRLLLAIGLAAITCLATTDLESPLIPHQHDKLEHLLAFFLLALLADRAFSATPWSWRKALPLLGYGLVIEIIQSFIPYRDFSLADLLADAVGLVVYTLTPLRLVNSRAEP